MDFTYSVFGLVVRSNVAILGVPVASSSAPDLSPRSEVQFHLGIEPYPDASRSPREKELVYISSYLDESGDAVLRIWKTKDEGYLRLVYCDGTQFWIDGSRRYIWGSWPENLTLENALSYLLGPVFGLLLRLRGVTCLHASAVAIDDWGIVFVGSEGAGKSTTAAAFAKQGYAVLSDDIVALTSATIKSAQEAARVFDPVPLEKEFHVLPAYPHLCLWPDSVQMLYGAGEPLPRLSPEWDKRRLSLGTDGTRFEMRTLPVGAIYLFAERGPDPAPYIEPARGQTSLVSLLANTYANNLLDRAMRGEEFAVLDRLVASVPIRVLTPHKDPARIEQLCDCIRQDFQSLAGAGGVHQRMSEHQT